ncbi:MAG: FixH family protein [Alphaproteobacteria bacterium]
MIRFFACVAFAACCSSAAQAQERMGAEVSCNQIGKTMAHDCLLTLKGKASGQPIQGAAILVGADMPTMPMAHNVKPVKAEPTGRPGEYRFRIELDMHGEWALKIRLAKPRQDLIVHKMMFAKPAQ